MHYVRLPVFNAIVSKTIDQILSAHFHFVSRVVMAFEINSPVRTELLIGRAGVREVLLHSNLKFNKFHAMQKKN